MPKAPKSPRAPPQKSLVEEYAPSSYKQKKAKRLSKGEHEGEEARYVDAKASKSILQLGSELAQEAESESQVQRPPVANPAFDFATRALGEEDDIDDPATNVDDEEAWGDEEEEIVEEVEIDPNDLASFNKFYPTDDDPITWPGAVRQQDSNNGGGTDLAALILAKIAEHEAAAGDNQERPEVMGGGDPEDAVEIPAKVVEVYSKVGLILSRYKSGRLPKPVKILPTIGAWPDLIAITAPESWTPNAVLALTRIFISSKPANAQLFLNSVLLPAVQNNIAETQKLNVHLYNALKKALYKPACFMKAIVFPLLTEGCTQFEARVIASVISKVSIPVLHSAAALHRCCEIAAEQMSSDPESAGPANIFIKTLLEKKYALPFRVIDSCVFHFLRFKAAGASHADAMAVDGQAGDLGSVGKLPVLWHQCLLAFAQRYRNDITEDQREALLDLLLTRGHKSISPEIRRELLEGRGRGVVIEPSPIGADGDDTMIMAVDG